MKSLLSDLGMGVGSELPEEQWVDDLEELHYQERGASQGRDYPVVAVAAAFLVLLNHACCLLNACARVSFLPQHRLVELGLRALAEDTLELSALIEVSSLWEEVKDI